MIRPTFAASLVFLALGGALAAEADSDRALLVIAGHVTIVERAAVAGDSPWTDAWVLADEAGASPVRVRIAPSSVLDSEEFRLAPGDRVQVRVFSDESPYAAQQIRNRETGRMLRLRALHGEPLWASRPGSEPQGGAILGPGGAASGSSRVRSGR